MGLKGVSRGLIKRILPLNFVLTFISFLDTHLLIPIIALYASSLDASTWMVGLIVGLYSITNTPANLFFGRLIDRIGYKIPLTAGLLGDALGMFFYALCRSPVHLGLVRAFHGISGGIAGPATMSITAEQTTGKGKGRAMAFYGMSIAAATLVGYGLGGSLASALGYKSVFYLGAVMLVLGTFLALLMPQVKTTPGTRKPLGQDLREMGSLFRRKGLFPAYCAIFAQYFAFGGVVTLLPLYISELGMQAFHVGMLLSIFVLAFIISQFPSGALSDKIGRQIPAASGLSLGIISLMILPIQGTFFTIAIAMALYGLAYALLFPSISALIADHTEPEERGKATGLFHSLLTAGVATGAPVMGWVGGLTGSSLGLLFNPVVLALALFIFVFSKHSSTLK